MNQSESLKEKIGNGNNSSIESISQYIESYIKKKLELCFY